VSSVDNSRNIILQKRLIWNT